MAWLFSVAWLPPFGPAASSSRMVPFAEIVLCAPFLLGSILVEYLVARRMLPECAPADVLKWSRTANELTYLAIVVVLIGWVAYELFGHK